MASAELMQTRPVEYTADEVAAHRSQTDNWMIIHGEGW